jgi:signal transduction histidine kinase
MDTADIPRMDLEQILSRIRQKKENYVHYNFSREQNDLLRTFFDLAQEFDTLEDFYRICVGILYEFMQLESGLYLLDEKEKSLQLVCDSKKGIIIHKTKLPKEVHLSDEAYTANDSYLIPIYRKPLRSDNNFPQVKSKIMGIFQVYPLSKLTSADQFFLDKYTNRIGYNLYNRTIANHNINHLSFINNLVMDIEHNVITPNIYFKHLFKQLGKSIKDMGALENFVKDIKASPGDIENKCATVLDKIASIHKALSDNQRHIEEYHATTSLFLESLFRRDHFEQGHLVLLPKLCSVSEEIVEPQLEQYEKRLNARGITVEKPTDMVGEEILLNVDIGLLAQVYANFFSNAVKYTEEIVDEAGNPKKSVAYGREMIRNFFGLGLDGIKCNVFTTGKHLPAQEAEEAFKEGYRGEGGKALPGTGHGLAFVKQVIEMHGGVVGYEPTEQGNNFYFILPIPERLPFQSENN